MLPVIFNTSKNILDTFLYVLRSILGAHYFFYMLFVFLSLYILHYYRKTYLFYCFSINIFCFTCLFPKIPFYLHIEKR